MFQSQYIKATIHTHTTTMTTFPYEQGSERVSEPPLETVQVWTSNLGGKVRRSLSKQFFFVTRRHLSFLLKEWRCEKKNASGSETLSTLSLPISIEKSERGGRGNTHEGRRRKTLEADRKCCSRERERNASFPTHIHIPVHREKRKRRKFNGGFSLL